MVSYPAFDGNQPCRQVDPELFFPTTFNAVTRKDKALMTDICNDCRMREPCLLWALHHERDGFWAGTTPEDRIKLRRKLKIQFESVMLPIMNRRAS